MKTRNNSIHLSPLFFFARTGNASSVLSNPLFFLKKISPTWALPMYVFVLLVESYFVHTRAHTRSTVCEQQACNISHFVDPHNLFLIHLVVLF